MSLGPVAPHIGGGGFKRVTSFRLAGDHPVVTSTYDGRRLVPLKVELAEFLGNQRDGVRVSVTVTGRAKDGYRSAKYGLVGYERYERCPEWLVPVLREAGYTGEVRR